ncbi:Carboxypeptidase regulatory-like domain-containing protein [Sulfidibacter corallicola]|uniref:Carboxypeptidase regulatory-like domain-containing protein n=1 Tax=Sulfidibacter corallicola TaxID=2818388 RepID=A0A8A4TIL3_SULCO|nr:LamG-like jellyroll fold domain-containing protein [Sulfidibacter corallicola]QTD49453.1 carboxypeptidase regulatory-like domain-containing protein [Sulfidibacter corallicola]
MTRKLVGLLAPLWLGLTLSALASDTLFEMKRLGLRLEPAQQILLLGHPEPHVEFQLFYDGDMNQATRLRAELQGPGITTPIAVDQAAADGLTIQLDRTVFESEGTYRLTDVRLEQDGRVLAYAQPQQAEIEVVRDLVVTRVEVRELDMGELQRRGYLFSEDDFESVAFNMSLVMGAKQVDVEVPVLLPKKRSRMIQPQIIRDPFQPYVHFMWVPEGLGNSAGGMPYADREYPEPETDRYHILSLLAVPGNFNYLKSHFSVTGIVLNAAPEGYQVQVRNLKARIALPEATRYGVPLRLSQQDSASSVEKPMTATGVDGLPGTGDDADYIDPGEEASAEFLLIGDVEGMYEVAVSITGEADLPQGTRPVSASATGMVYVRSPDFSVTYEHPDTVAESEAYDFYMHFTNRGGVPLQGLSVELDPFKLIGTQLEDGWNPIQSLPTIPAGGEGTIHYRFVSRVTGTVVASYYKLEDGSPSNLSLGVGVAETGERLSPFVLHFPPAFETAFGTSLSAELKRMGKKLLDFSQTAESELPEGVLPVTPTAVKTFNTGMAQAARNLELGLTDRQSHAQLLTHFMRSGADHEPIDLLRRRFIEQESLDLEQAWGDRLAAVFAGMDDASLLRLLAQENEATPGLFMAILDADRPFSWRLEDGAGRALGNRITERKLPFASWFPLSDRRTLIWYGGGETTPTLTFARDQGDSEPLQVRTQVVLPQTSAGAQYLVGSDAVTLDATPVRFGFDHELGLLQLHQNGQVSEHRGDLIPKKSFDLLSVSQLDRLIWHQADDFGRDILLAFSKEVDLASLDPIEEHLFFNGQPAYSVQAQTDGRFLVVGARQPLGPYHDIRYEIRGARARDGQRLPTLEGIFRGSSFYTGTSVAGTVVDRNGSDLSQGRVYLWLRDIVNSPDVPVYRVIDEVELDENGRYRFDFVPFYPFGESTQALLEQFRLGVLLEDGRYDTRDFTIQGVGGEIAADFAFLQRGSIWGQVIDESGQPVADVEVYGASQDNPQRSAAITRTDASGFYHLDGLEVGQVLVKVGARNGLIAMGSGYLTERTSPLRIDVQLNQPTGTLTGTVTVETDAGTAPLAGAVVGWVLEGQTYSTVRLGPFLYPVNILTQADDQGRFRLEHAPAGTGVLFAWHQDAVYRYQKVTLPADAEANYDFHYDQSSREGGTISGTVVDAHGYPIAGANVTTLGGGTFITDTDGEFRFERIPFAFGISLFGSRPGTDLKGSATVSLDAQNPHADNVVLVLRQPVAVRGRYLDAEGDPIPFANIYNPYNDGRKPKIFATTNGNGEWEGSLADFSGHPLSEPGEGIQTGINYFTGSMPPSIAMTEVFVGLEGLDNVLVQHEPLSSFRVTLTDGLGNPVIGTVEVTGQAPSIHLDSMGMPSQELLYSLVTDHEGRRTFDRIPVGSVTVKGVHPQLGETEPLTFELQPQGGTIQEISLAFAHEDPANLFGKIFDVDGVSPAPAGTLVMARIASTGLTATVAVDPEGFYHFEDLVNTSEPTFIHLAAYRPDDNHFAVENLQLHQDLHFRHDMILRRKGNVHIGVQHADGSQADFAVVQMRYREVVYQPDTGEGAHFNLNWVEREIQITPDAPIAHFSDLPVSQFTVKALGQNGLTGLRRYSLPLAGGDLDLTVQLEAASSIAGTFIDHDELPVVDAEVQLFRQRSLLHQKVTGNEGEQAGRFLFEDLPMRTYRLKGTDPRTAFESHMEVTTSPFLPNPDVVLRLDPLAHLEGIVYRDGQPLAGATVRLENGDFSLVTGTDSAGRYRFRNLALGEYELTSQTPSTPARAADGVHLALADETVTRDLHYEPVYEALLTVRHADETPADNVRLIVDGTDNHLQQIVFTDANGQARLNGLIKGRYYTYAEHPELRLELRDSFSISEASVSPVEQTVRFPGWGSIGGQVRDSLGETLSRPVTVTFTWGWGDIGVKRWSITTDAEGRFYKSGVPLNERVRVSTTDPETFVSGVYEVVLAHTGEHHEENLILTATTHGTGQVTYQDGSPAPYAEVWVETPTKIKIQADDNGDFQFYPLVQGEVTLFAKDRFSPRRTAQTLNIEPGPNGSLEPRFNLALPLGGIANVSGTVTLSDGTPVRAGHVRLEVEELGAVLTSTIMANGSYFFTHVPQGEYRLSAYDANLTETSPVFEVARPEDGASITQDIQFQPSFDLAGDVIRGDLSGVADAIVELWRREPGTTRFHPVYATTADSNGHYRIQHVYPASYRLIAKDPLADLVAQFEFDMTSGDRLDFDVLLQAQSNLLGRVVDADTVPYSSGRVTLFDSGGARLGTESIDANGEFRFDNLTPGNYRVSLYAEAGWIQEDHDITLIAGLNNLPIQTAATAEVSGQAIFQILPARQPALYLIKDGLWRMVQLNASGHFLIDHVPVGSTLTGVLKSGRLLKEFDFGMVTADIDLGTLYLDGIAPELQAPAQVQITSLPHPLTFPLVENEADSAVDPARTRVWWNDEDISYLFTTGADSLSTPLDLLPDSATPGDNRLVIQVGNRDGATASTEISVDVQLTAGVVVAWPTVGGQPYAGSVTLDRGEPVATDAQDRAIFYDVAPGDHTLRARGGLLGARIRVQTDLSRPAYNLGLEMTQHGGYRGTVYGPDGEPVSGVVLEIGAEREISDTDGIYLFDLLPLGFHRVYAEGADMVGTMQMSRLTVNQAILDGTDIHLVGEGTLRGVVYDHEGVQPVPGVQVTLSFPGKTDYFERTTLTQGDGSYLFEQTATWPFELEAYEPVSKRRGLVSGQLGTAGQVLERDILLAPAADLSGVLHHVDGSPANGVTLRVFDKNHDYAEAVTAADGSFTLADVPHGPLELEGDHLPTREYLYRELTVEGTSMELGTLTMAVDQPPEIDLVQFPNPLDPLLDRWFALQVRDDRALGEYRLTFSGDWDLTFEEALDGAILDTDRPHRLPTYYIPDGSVLNYELVLSDHRDQTDVATGSFTVQRDLQGPSLTVQSPAAETAFDEGQPITFAVTADDPSGIDRVELAYQGVTWATDTDAPFELTMTAPPVDAAEILDFTVTAYDRRGNATSVQHPLTIRAVVTSGAPSLVLQSPLEGMPLPLSLEAGLRLEVRAEATDPDGLQSCILLLDGQEVYRETLNGTQLPLAFAVDVPESMRQQASLTATLRVTDLGGNAADAEARIDNISGTVWNEAAPLTVSRFDLALDGATHILAGGTHTIDGRHEYANLVLVNGAVLTQTQTGTNINDVAFTELRVAGHLVVDAGSRVDVDGKGYPGAPFEYPQGTSGSHGGLERDEDDAEHSYGSVVAPGLPGAMNGGGAVDLDAADLWLSGTVSADGPNTNYGSAGGSILLAGTAIHGYGTARANGFSGPFETGPALRGGGGRLAVYGDPGSINLEAFGGDDAGAGTIYIRQVDPARPDGTFDLLRVAQIAAADPANKTPVAELRLVAGTDFEIFHNEQIDGRFVDRLALNQFVPPGRYTGYALVPENDPGQRYPIGASMPSALLSREGESFPDFADGEVVHVQFDFDRIEVSAESRLHLTGHRVPGPIHLEDAKLSGGVHEIDLDGFEVQRVGANTLTGRFHAHDFTVGEGETLYLDGTLRGHDLTVPTGSRLTAPPNQSGAWLRLEADTLNVHGEVAATTNGVALGYAAGHHGGLTTASPNLHRSYGSFYEARSFGGDNGIALGGGRVELAARVLNIEGLVDVGSTSSYVSGGSIRLEGEELAGSGHLRANGRFGVPNNLYSSGGGRIAILVDRTESFTGSITAYGYDVVDPYAQGGAGTIFFRTEQWPLGRLLVDNGGHAAPADSTPLPGLGQRTAATATGGVTIEGGDFRGHDSLVGLHVVVPEHEPIPIAANTEDQLSADGSFPSLAAGASYSGLHVLDVLEVRGGASLYSPDPFLIHDEVIVDGGTLNAETELVAPTTIKTLNDGSAELFNDDGTTVYELDNYQLIVHFPMDVERLTLRNGSSLTFTQPLQVETLTLEGSTLIDGVDAGHPHLRADAVSLTSASTWTIADRRADFTAHTIEAQVTGALVVDATSEITTSGVDRVTHQAPIWADEALNLRSHGGFGARENEFGDFAHYTDVPTVGSAIYPQWPGSVKGGGVIRLEAGSLDLAGTIRADGEGPGTGGSIWLGAPVITGAGTLSAQSGQDHQFGGGRIAVHYGNDRSFMDRFTVRLDNPNTGTNHIAYWGGSGTLFVKGAAQAHGELIVNQRDYPNVSQEERLTHRYALTGVASPGRRNLALADEDPDPLVIKDATWFDLPPSLAGLFVRFTVDATPYEARIVNNSHSTLFLAPPTSGTLPATVPAGTRLDFVLKLDRLALNRGAMLRFDGILEVGQLDLEAGEAVNSIWAQDIHGLGETLTLTGQNLRLTLDEPGLDGLDLSLTDSVLYLDKPIRFGDVTLTNSRLRHTPTYVKSSVAYLPWLHVEADHVIMDASSRFDVTGIETFWVPHDRAGQISHGGLNDVENSEVYGSLFHPDMPGSGSKVGGRIYLRANRVDGGAFHADSESGAAGSIWLDVDTLAGDIHLSAARTADQIKTGGGRIAVHYDDRSAAHLTFDSRGHYSSGTVFLKQKDAALGRLEIDNQVPADDQTITPLPSFPPMTLPAGTEVQVDGAAGETTLTVPGLVVGPWFRGYELIVNDDRTQGMPILANWTVGDDAVFRLAGTGTIQIGDQVQLAVRLAELDLCTGCRLDTTDLIFIYDSQFDAGHRFENGERTFPSAPEVADGHLMLDNFQMTIQAPVDYDRVTLSNGASLVIAATEAGNRIGEITIEDGTLSVAGPADGVTPTLHADRVHIQNGTLEVDHLKANVSIEIDTTGKLTGFSESAEGLAWGNTTLDGDDWGTSFGGIGQPKSYAVYVWSPTYGDFKRPFAVGYLRRRLKVETPQLRVDGLLAPAAVETQPRAGALWIETGTLSGTGAIQANGGVYASKVNGGGRIALYYTDMAQWQGSLEALGLKDRDSDRFTYVSGSGTIFLKRPDQPHGDLIVHGHGEATTHGTTPMVSLGRHTLGANASVDGATLHDPDAQFPFSLAGLYLRVPDGAGERELEILANTPTSITVSESLPSLTPGVEISATLHLDQLHLDGFAQFRTEDHLVVHDALTFGDRSDRPATLWARRLTLPSTTLTLAGRHGGLVVDETHNLTDIELDGASLMLDQPFAVDRLELTNGSVLTHSPLFSLNFSPYTRLAGIDLTVQELLLDATSAIDVRGKGYASKPDDYLALIGLSGIDFGRGHGGESDNQNGGYPYGSAFHPQTPGFLGGAGRVHVAAQTAQLDGTIDASGFMGGSIWLEIGQWSGSGQILADGGSADGIAASAGRIAIHYDQNDFIGMPSAKSPIRNNRQFGAGTLYLRDRAAGDGDLYLVNGDPGNATVLDTPIWGIGTHVLAEASADPRVIAVPNADWRIGVEGLQVIDDSNGAIYIVMEATPDRLVLDRPVDPVPTAGWSFRGRAPIATVYQQHARVTLQFPAEGDYQVVEGVDLEPPVTGDILVRPAFENSVESGQAFEVTVTAVDNVAVTGLTLHFDGSDHQLAGAGPFVFDLQAPSVTETTSFELRATAVDARGNQAISALTLSVVPADQTLPAVQIEAPLENAEVDGGADLTTRVQFSDNRALSEVHTTFAEETRVNPLDPPQASLTEEQTWTAPVGGGDRTMDVTFTAIDLAGNRVDVTRSVLVRDVTAPANPQNLIVTPGDTSLDLSWTAPEDPDADLAGYRLFLDGSANPVASLTNETQYTLTGLEPGTTYQLRLTSIDGSDNESEGLTQEALTSGGSGASLPAPTAWWSFDHMEDRGPVWQFDGTAAHVDMANASGIGRSAAALTLAAWVKIPSSASAGYRGVLTVADTHMSDLYAVLRLSSYRAELIGQRLDTLSYRSIRDNTSLNDDRWHRLVGVLDFQNDVAVLYVDGEEMARRQPLHGDPGQTIDRDVRYVQIGRVGSYSQYFDGSIWNAQVYRSAWSAETVQRDFRNPQRPLTTTDSGATMPPAGIWLHQDLLADRITDSSGNGFHGENQGAVKVSGTLPLTGIEADDGEAMLVNQGAASRQDLAPGSALLLAESDAVVMHTSTALEPYNQVSMHLKVRLDALPSGTGQAMHLVGQPQGGPHLRINAGDQLELDLGGVLLTGTNALTTGRWYSVVVSHDVGGNTRLYLDGVVTAESAASGSLGVSGGVWTFGNTGSGDGLRGSLDDVALWEETLTSGQVLQVAGSSLDQVLADQQAPADPRNLTWEPTTSQVTLNWLAPEGEAPTAFHLYLDGIGGADPVVLGPDMRTYLVDGLAADQAVAMRLTSVDAAGNESAGVVFTARTRVADPVIADLPNPVAHWDLDEPQNQPASLYFDGNATVDLGRASHVRRSASAMTLAASIKLPADTDINRSTRVVLSIANHLSADYHIALQLQNGQAEVRGQRLDSQTTRYIRGADDLRDGRWHRLVGVIDYLDDRMTLYVDGVQVNERNPFQGSGGLAEDVPSQSVQIGNHGTYSQRPTGQIYNVQIWRAAWTADHVAYDFDRPQGLVSEMASSGLDRFTQLVGWWKLNAGSGSTLVDHSGNGFHGEGLGTTWIQDADPLGAVRDRRGTRHGHNRRAALDQGLFGEALRFDSATSSRVLVDHRPEDTFGPAMTLGLWFRLDALPSAEGKEVALLGKADDGTGFQLFVDKENYLACRLQDGRGLRALGRLEADAWHHAVLSWQSGDRMRLYLDGVEAASLDTTQAVGLADADWLWATNHFGGMSFDGRLDQISLWDRALTAGQVAGLHQAEPTGGLQPLVEDLQPPGAIRDLTWNPGLDRLDFTWTAPDPDLGTVDGYRVFFDGATQPVSLGAGTAAFSVESLNPGTEYGIRIVAFDAAGNEGPGVTAMAATESDTTPVTTSETPIAHWPMDFSEATETKALWNGTSSVVDISGAEDLIQAAEGLTVSAWVRVDPQANASSNRTIFSGRSTSETYLLLQLNNGRPEVMGQRLDADPTVSVRSSDDIRDGQWHHVVGVLDYTGNRIALYVDGILDKEDTTFQNSGGGLGEAGAVVSPQIGKALNWSRYFKGNIWNVQVWRAAFGADHVTYAHRHPHDLASDDPAQSGLIESEHLYGWWKLGTENAVVADASSNGRTGQFTDPAWQTDADPVVTVPETQNGHDGLNHGAELSADGHAGRALRFGDDPAYVAVPEDSVLNPAEWTWSMWVKPSALPSASGQDMALVSNLGASDGMALVLSREDRLGWMGDGARIESGLSIEAGVWQHLVVTAAGSTLRFYRDGVLAGESTASLSAAATRAWTFGALNDRDQRPFRGTLDEPTLWDRALTADQVRALFLDASAKTGAGKRTAEEEASSDRRVTLPEPTYRPEITEIRGERLTLDGFESDGDLWLVGSHLEVTGPIVARNIYLRDGSSLSHPKLAFGQIGGLQLVAAEKIDIDASSVIDLDGKGWTDPEDRFSASHGGLATDEPAEHRYGSPVLPVQPGRGERGGGAVMLQAPELVLDGTIRARGLGLSSGGSVLAKLIEISGRGIIDVSCGQKQEAFGGGGRVALHHERRHRFGGRILTGAINPGSLILADRHGDRPRIHVAQTRPDLLNLLPHYRIGQDQIAEELQDHLGSVLKVTSERSLLELQGLWLRAGSSRVRVREVLPLDSDSWYLRCEGYLPSPARDLQPEILLQQESFGQPVEANAMPVVFIEDPR